jgi:hypothetical protein
VYDGFCELTVGHDFEIARRAVTLGFGIGDSCARGGLEANTIGHDLIVSDNSALVGFFGPSALEVGNNRVGHDLVFTRNTAVPGGCLEVSDNVVGHDARAGAAPPNHANRLKASFTETAGSVTNRIADLKTFQLINTGSGTVEGFGVATVVVGITQDRSVTPCGPGSWTNAATRRIVVDEGVLILRELSIACPTSSGPVITGTYEVDGPSSTGIFAGARGPGDFTVDVATATATLSGKLKLAGSNGD